MLCIFNRERVELEYMLTVNICGKLPRDYLAYRDIFRSYLLPVVLTNVVGITSYLTHAVVLLVSFSPTSEISRVCHNVLYIDTLGRMSQNA